MRDSVVIHFDPDPLPPHFLSDSGGGAGSEKAVQDKAASVGGDVDGSLNQVLRLRSVERSQVARQLNWMGSFCPMVAPTSLAVSHIRRATPVAEATQNPDDGKSSRSLHLEKSGQT